MSLSRTPIKEHRAKRPRDDEVMRQLEATPRVSGTSLRIVDIMDSRFAKLAESMAELIRASETRIVAECNSSIEGLRAECCALGARVGRVEATTKVISTLRDDIGELTERICYLENSAVASDLRLRGIALVKCDKLDEIFHNLCTTINISKPAMKRIYAFNSKIKSDTSDVRVNLGCHVDRNDVLRAVSKFRKLNKINNLCLYHAYISLNNDGPLYINENLSKVNHKIFKLALSLKKEKKCGLLFAGVVWYM